MNTNSNAEKHAGVTALKWTSCFRIFNVTLLDGTRASGPLMFARGDKGKKVYRKMTDAEESDYESSSIW